MADSVAQNYATLLPDGTVLFVFDGKMRARGLDLDAGIATPVDINKVRWIRADGAVVGYIGGYETVFPNGVLEIAATQQSGETNTTVRARATGSGGDISQVSVLQGAAGTGQLNLTAEGAAATALNAAGGSDFARIGGPHVANKKTRVSGLWTGVIPALGAGALSAAIPIVHNLGSAVLVPIVTTNQAQLTNGGIAASNNQWNLFFFNPGPALGAGNYWIAFVTFDV